MKLFIIRHGDPDYINDSLTEKGIREARLLSEYLSQQKIDAFYVSPLGRAQKTASYTLERLNAHAETLPWLEEFAPRIHRPDRSDKMTRAWDWLPQDWTRDDRFYDVDLWKENEIFREGKVAERYEEVVRGLDDLLKQYGYEREGKYYRVTHESHDCICLFCHFGVEMVILSHLLNVSPMPLWHGFVAVPSSVTTIYTEERRQSIASFRIRSFGETIHLYDGKEEPSFQARFSECYGDDTPHD